MTANVDVTTWRSFAERVDVDATKLFFDEDGYVRLERFLTSEEIVGVNSRLSAYRKTVVPEIPSKFVFYEDKSNADSIIRLERMLWHDEYFKKLADSPAFNGLADLALGTSCRADNVQWFSKPPGAKATPPHQVEFAFPWLQTTFGRIK